MNPWLSIPAADYEGHMGPGGADQLAPLARIFGEVVGEARPPSVALLGCATGNGLEAIDPAVTSRVVGVDLNPEYLALARSRHGALGDRLDLRCADLLTCALEPAAFALVHAALVFEHLDPAALAPRIAGWLATGGLCSVVLQAAAPGEAPPPVSRTGFSSLEALSATMRLVSPPELTRLFAAHGLGERRAWQVPLPHGKAFQVAIYDRPAGVPGRLAGQRPVEASCRA
ncbi:MAG TPA: class I SAM-dependent methyltransferase [Polyangia bacterium]|nr:class I SAM-dependent methyltransferase [Polyangia bacterium]